MGLFKATDVAPEYIARLSTGEDELDWQFGRPLDWGFPKGRIILITGESGCGKTRLLTQLVRGWDGAGLTTMFCQGEVSVGQFVAEKFGTQIPQHCFLSDDMSIDDQILHIAKTKPAVCITDSIQQIEEYNGGKGAKECCRKIRSVISKTGTVMVLISQMTVLGTTRGGTELPHEVDILAYLKRWGPQFPDFVILTIHKNRYGQAGKESIMAHKDWGIEIQSKNRMNDAKWMAEHSSPARRGLARLFGR